MAPETVTGRHRMTILKPLAAAKTDSTVRALSAKTGLCPTTIRTHLKAMEGLGIVARTNYRRWRLAPGITLGALDGSTLDPGGSHVASR